MKNLVFIVFLLIVNVLFAQTNTELFNEATDKYANGNFEGAIENYEAILDKGETSANLYYNLGNAHYKLDHIAPSIYYYEKALQLDPNHQDAKNNLVFAEKMTLDAIEEVPKSNLSRTIDNTISTFSYDGWAWFAVVASLIAAFLFLAYLFVRVSLKKRLFFAGFLLSIIISITAVIFAFAQYDLQQSKQFAIVFEDEISIKSEPNPSSDEAFLLHEGTKAKILDEFNGFYKIELANGNQGWAKTSALKKL